MKGINQKQNTAFSNNFSENTKEGGIPPAPTLFLTPHAGFTCL